MILANMPNFKVLAFLLSTSQKFPFRNGTSHCDSIFTPWNRGTLQKNHFSCMKTSFLEQIHTPPPPPMHFHGFEVKQKHRILRMTGEVTDRFNEKLCLEWLYVGEK